MCKAMGLNAISSYFAWNDFEQPDGSFDFKTANRDVAAFLSLCKEEGMWVLFRPGPYICGEWDFGGIPPRLLKDDVAVRTMDPRYLAEAEKYLSAIADVAEPFLSKNGGPIVLTQIENEYGSWPFKDVEYLRWVKDFWKKRGFGPFYMADGAGDRFLKDLIYPDPEIAVGFDPGMDEKDWSFAKKYNPGVPVLSAETYPGWLRHWGEGKWEPSDITKSVKWFMEGRRSFCFFVAHGGTSFGFTAGANDGGEGGYEPDLTSYDYGAPIDEQGRPTKAYYDYRKILDGQFSDGFRTEIVICNHFRCRNRFGKQRACASDCRKIYATVSYNRFPYFRTSLSFSDHSRKSQIQKSRGIFVHTAGRGRSRTSDGTAFPCGRRTHIINHVSFQ